ncbi:alanine racemase [Nocardia goodfellowii]|uniref:Diaminopimelate decarboxylase n=1 Tax=Nocardia goodfellowii TaxID=882446 RepID=A0ABS4QPB5_9NOCA|nr:alanine racemase [Nocardia goodfellowii]MBP2193540.1 diaminopimelate decarboxylase [Nocardia goodfellowii]
MDLSTELVKLPALEREWQRRVRCEPGFLFDIQHAVGGPFHVVYPRQFERNLRSFQEVLAAHRVSGRVYYGKKANKAGCWLDVIADHDGSVDVASEPELVHALAHGVRGRDIGVTGAAKSAQLLRLAARHDCVVAVDALDELERLAEIAATAGRVRILLRRLPTDAPDSRFGLSGADLDYAVTRCGQLASVELIGFSFHLDGYQVRPRAELAYDLITLCAKAKAQGHPISAISVGGGFACSYLSAADWAAFTERGTDELFHAGKRFDKFYPYAQGPNGAAMLDAILSTAFDGRALAEHLPANDLELFLEPGRALLIDAGFTAFPVLGFKRNADYGITTVQGLSMSVSEQWKGSEFLPDPILLPRNVDPAAAPTASCVGGSSCMEYDVLTWRKIILPQPPQFGDLLLYPNTAGYQMDKNESEFHQLPLPPKVVVTDDGDRLSWRLDR